jgi:Flp pilus assembly protein TadG
MDEALMFGLKAFWEDRRGSTAFVFSLVLIPMTAVFSLALDYSSVTRDRTQYQAIVDSAALAGATAGTNDTDDIRKKRAQDWFDTQVALRGYTPAGTSITISKGEIVVAASFVHKSKIKMVNFSDMTVNVAATALLTQEKIRRVLDVAMCIDATGSMQNTIDSVKARAQSFSVDLNNALKARGLEEFDYMRIRGIFYRDYNADRGIGPVYSASYIYDNSAGTWVSNAPPMTKSEFFPQPAQKGQFEAFIGSEKAMGGGDTPEASYECINEAMASKWFKKNDPIPGTDYTVKEVYPTIILWSDAAALPIPHQKSIESRQLGTNIFHYPPDMPRSQAAFTSKWNNSSVIDTNNKLLVHFGLCNNSSWAFARSLNGYMCGGSLSEGNNNMINKIADVMAVRYQNKLTRLAK